VGLVCAAAAAAGMGRWMALMALSPPRSPRRPPGRGELAVLPLADETGDPSLAWTAGGVAEMLSAQLAESSELRVLESSRVVDTLRDLDLTRSPGDETTLRRLSQLLEVGSW